MVKQKQTCCLCPTLLGSTAVKYAPMMRKTKNEAASMIKPLLNVKLLIVWSAFSKVTPTPAPSRLPITKQVCCMATCGKIERPVL